MIVRRRVRIAALVAAAAGLLTIDPGAALARSVALVGNLRDGTVSVVDTQALRVLGRFNVVPDGKTPRDPAQAAIYPLLVKLRGVNYVQGLALSPNGHT